MSNPLSSTLSLTSFSNARVDEDHLSSAFANADPFDDGPDVSEYESLRMPSLIENGSDDTDSERLLSKTTFRTSVGPFPIKKNRDYHWAPTPYKADVLSVDEIRDLNGYINEDKNNSRPASWRDRLDVVNRPQTYTGAFMCQFPLPIHNPQQMKFADLTFTLPSGSENVEEFTKRLVTGNGQIKLSFTQQQLAAVFGKVPNLGRNDHSIIPYTIRIVEEHANLPDDFVMQLTTAKVTKDERSKRYQHWIRNAGAHNRSEGIASLASTHSHIVYRNIHRVSTHEHVDLFIADDELYNSGDFHRWLNADEDRIWQEFNDCRVPGRSETLHIPCGPDDMIRCHTVLQGLVQTEHQELALLSKQFDHPPPKITTNEHSQDVHEVSAKAVEHLMSRVFAKIDKDKILMRLEDVAVTLSLLRSQGQQGLMDLRKKSAEIVKQNLPGRYTGCYYPEFMVRIQIAYSCCDHPARSKPSGSSVASNGVGSGDSYGALKRAKSSGVYSMPKSFLPE